MNTSEKSTDKPAPDKSMFGYTVADITRLFRRVFDRRSAHLGLTRVQWRALSRIERSQGLSQKQLAEDLDLEPIAVGRVIDRLEIAGFIERRAHPDDRRCWSLYLAPKSADVMAGMKRISSVLRDDVLQRIDPQELAITLRVLATVKDTLSELDRDGRPNAARRQARP
jgi:MarR family transcriptional regulator, transcriptional regulator for hemolysin